MTRDVRKNMGDSIRAKLIARKKFPDTFSMYWEDHIVFS